MNPSEGRRACLMLLAELDQQITEAEYLAANPLLSDDERRAARAELEFRKMALERRDRIMAAEVDAM